MHLVLSSSHARKALKPLARYVSLEIAVTFYQDEGLTMYSFIKIIYTPALPLLSLPEQFIKTL